MSSLDQLLRQSKALLDIIDELINMIKNAKDKLSKHNFSQREMIFLNI